MKHLLEKGNGKTLPDGTMPCWYVDERERSNALSQNRQFCHHFTTNDYFKIINYIGTDCIEGYLGRTDRHQPFFSDFDTSLTYFIDYKSRQDIFFTFDKTVLYKVIRIIPDNPFLFILMQLNNKSMPNEKSENLIHQTIIHAGDGNTITTGNHNIITAITHIYKGNLDSFKRALEKHHVQANDIDEIVTIVQNEQPCHNGKLGNKTTGWINKMITKAKEGTWQVGIGTAGGLLTEIIKYFFGIK